MLVAGTEYIVSNTLLIDRVAYAGILSWYEECSSAKRVVVE